MYNLKNIFRFKRYITIVNFCIAFVLIFLTSGALDCVQSAYNSLNETDVFSSGYLTGIAHDENAYYRNILGLKTLDDDNKIYDTKILMTSKKCEKYGDTYLTKFNGVDIEDSFLNEDECSISKHFSYKNSVKVGDFVKVLFKEEIFNYKVKYIFDDFFGFDAVDPFKKQSLIVLGEKDEVIDSDTPRNYYYFSKVNTPYAKEDIMVKKVELNKLNIYKRNIYLISVFSTLGIALILEIFCQLNYYNDLKVYKRYGLSKRKLFTYGFLNYCLKYLPTILIVVVISSVVNLILHVGVLPILYMSAIYVGVTFIISSIKDIILIRRIS